MIEIDSFKKYEREGAYHYKLMSSDQFYVAKINKALSLVNPGAVVWDIGCGDGVFLKYAREMGASTFGMDTSLQGIELARTFSGCENLCIGSANSLPLKTSSADLIVMIDVINYIEDFAGAIGEASRALKDKGRLVIMSPHAIDINEENKTIPDSWQKHACTVESLRAAIEGDGDLDIEEIVYIRKPALAYIFRIAARIIRLLGIHRLIRSVSQNKPRANGPEHSISIDHFKKNGDIYLDYHNVPGWLIKEHEAIEFIIVAQKRSVK